MKSFRFISVGLFLLILLLSGGCMSVEYTGREFAPLSDGRSPVFFPSIKKIPAGDYAIVGRAELTASGSAHWEDIQKRLLEEAAKRGADAVAVVSRKVVKTTFYSDDSVYDSPSDRKVNPYNLTPDGAEIKVDMNGNPVGLPDGYHARVRVVVRALFYKDKIQLEKIISQRDKQLDRLINKPQALPGSSK